MTLYSMRVQVPGKEDAVDEEYTDEIADVTQDLSDTLENAPAGTVVIIEVSEGELD